MFEDEYPDILGVVTAGKRYEMATLQCAVGVFPRGAAVAQPFEVLIALQSTVSQPQEVTIELRLPLKDAAGHRLSFYVPRKQIKLQLGAGEVGLLHLPVVIQPPTPPATGYPLIVRVTGRPVAEARRVRSPGAGRPPSALSISPFRLDVLREVAFSHDGQAGQVRCRFDVIPGQVRVGLSNPEPKYEILWTAREHQVDQSRVDESIAIAESLALEMTRGTIFHHLEDATRERFGNAGLPLHPGEVLFITKSLTHVFEDAYQYETDYKLYDARWFQWLCSLIVRDPEIAERDLGELAGGELYLAALYDAVWVTLPMVQSWTGRRYGSPQEHRQYADKVVQAVQGNAPMDLGYAYLPLIMAGVLLNMRVAMRYENQWTSLDMLEEARRGRARLSGTRDQELFNVLDTLIAEARELLRRARVPKE